MFSNRKSANDILLASNKALTEALRVRGDLDGLQAKHSKLQREYDDLYAESVKTKRKLASVQADADTLGLQIATDRARVNFETEKDARVEALRLEVSELKERCFTLTAEQSPWIKQVNAVVSIVIKHFGLAGASPSRQSSEDGLRDIAAALNIKVAA